MTRRPLQFATLDDAVRDAEGLLNSGYDRVGHWDLAQVAGHLANWMTYPIDGFPRSPWLIRPMLWLMKVTVGRRKFESYIATKSLPAGSPTLPVSVPPAGQDAILAVSTFRQAVRRFQEYTGPLHPSPLFGPLTKDEATALQCLHCAHHLSFLVPKSDTVIHTTVPTAGATEPTDTIANPPA